MDKLCYWLIGTVVVVVIAAVIANNYAKDKYDALVKKAKAKGVDILSK